MTIDELNCEYNDFCNKSKVCADCKYNENFPCQMMFGYDKGRADAIDECLQVVQVIKDRYNNAGFGEQIPINYGTICGIIITLEHLKEKNI